MVENNTTPEQPQQVWTVGLNTVNDRYPLPYVTNGETTYYVQNSIEAERLAVELNTLHESNRKLQAELDEAKQHLNDSVVVASMQAERAEKLRQFKNYVHKRLDDMFIEKEPYGEHSKAGCRIGDRLDIVKNIINTAKNQRSLLIKLNHLLSNDSEYNRIDLQKER